MIDLVSPAAPGSLMRAVRITEPGLYRVSKRDAELYSVQITNSGVWGQLKVRDGTGRPLFEQTSTFTGSFVLGAGAEGGIIVDVFSKSRYEGPQVTINFRERDRS